MREDARELRGTPAGMTLEKYRVQMAKTTRKVRTK